MNTSIKTKINRIGKIGVIFAILLIISSVISLVMTIRQLVSYFQLYASIVSETMRASYLIGSVGSTVSWAVSIVVYAFLFRVATEFQRCDSPFEDNLIHQMSVFGWSLLGLAILSALFSGISNLIVTVEDYGGNTFNYARSIYEGIKALILPSLSLVVSLIVLCMVRIFRYGAQLQKQSDETL